MFAGDRLRAVIFFTIPVIASGCGAGSGTQSPSGAPLAHAIVVGSLLPPSGTIFFGAFVNTSGLMHGTNPMSVGALESQLGRKLAIDAGYQTFTSKFETRQQLDDYANGRIPIYSWDCGASNAAIASGSYDSSIRLQADSIKSYMWPVFVRYMWDPDLPSTQLGRSECYDPATDNADGSFSAVQYVAAWRRIRSIFLQEGAVNAAFVWSVSNVGRNSLAYYPGDSETEWVGMDAFDLSNATFTATFAPTYSRLAPFGKPIMIGATGANGLEQPAFFSGAARDLRVEFPQVDAFVYYDGIGSQEDWRIVPSAMAAFVNFARDPYVSGRFVAP